METMAKTDFRHRPVGEVVTEDYRRAGVFKGFGIDFCCGGGRTVQEACDRKGVDYEELEARLLASAGSRSGAAHPDPAGWPLDFLADYIVNVHHRYVREKLPVLRQFSAKVARVHGPGTPALVTIAELVEELERELEAHMAKEEDLLFPQIKRLVASRTGGLAPEAAKAEDSIPLLEEEHDRAGAIMRQLQELSDGYCPPEGACNTYRASYVMLEEFEEDLHRHVHLENNVLFPGTIRLAEEVAGETPPGASRAG